MFGRLCHLNLQPVVPVNDHRFRRASMALLPATPR